jgi:hypothetical protein
LVTNQNSPEKLPWRVEMLPSFLSALDASKHGIQNVVSREKQQNDTSCYTLVTKTESKIKIYFENKFPYPHCKIRRIIS